MSDGMTISDWTATNQDITISVYVKDADVYHRYRRKRGTTQKWRHLVAIAMGLVLGQTNFMEKDLASLQAQRSLDALVLAHEQLRYIADYYGIAEQ